LLCSSDTKSLELNTVALEFETLTRVCVFVCVYVCVGDYQSESGIYIRNTTAIYTYQT